MFGFAGWFNPSFDVLSHWPIFLQIGRRAFKKFAPLYIFQTLLNKIVSIHFFIKLKFH